jgi:AcrR family transcriptional regulator
MSNKTDTHEKILHFGKQEFLQKGFANASLRNIASAAGMTTGAIYTYFKDKNALFESVVAPVCDQVDKMMLKLSTEYYTPDGIVNKVNVQDTVSDLRRVYEMIYDNFDVFRLLVVGAEGSTKADFVHSIVDREVEYTLAYLDRIKKDAPMRAKLNRRVLHMVSESYINALMEPVRHNMSFDEAIENLNFLAVFYTGGWNSVFEKI